MIDILYFAWVRERIGEAKDQLETEAKTVSELVQELSSKDTRYAAAFADPSALRVAVDQKLVDFDASIIEAKEVAFFPPMTGG